MSTARIPLPDAALAPGVRDFIRNTAEFVLREMVGGWGLVAPAEGAGVTRKYLKAYRLCDAASLITDEIWAPLVANPPLEGPEERKTHPGEEPSTDWREKVSRHADRVHESGKTRGIAGADLAAVSATLATKRLDELPAFLTQQAPSFFEAFPEGSLWYVAVDATLMHRLTVMRALNALELTPDIVRPADFPGLRALEEHSITGGLRSAPLYDVLLTTFVPGALGFVFELMPHALVLLYGLNGGVIAHSH